MKVIDIIIKDLKIILSDKKALATMILMPIVLTTILSSALKGSFVDENNDTSTDIAIVKKYNKSKEITKFDETLQNSIMGINMSDEDMQSLIDNREELDIEEIFFDDFLENEKVKEILDYRIAEEEEALELLRGGEVSGVVILPEGFIYDISINLFTPFRNIVSIEIVGNPDRYIGYQITESIVTGFSDRVSSLIISKNVFIETAIEEEIGIEAFEDMGGIMEEISQDMEERSININYIELDGKEPISSFDYYAVAMTTMFILFSAGYGSRTLLEERDNITFQRMVMGGASKGKILAGKFFAMFVFALLQILVMILFSTIVLKVNWGNLSIVLSISLCTVFTISGIGTMVAALIFKAGNYKMANVFETAIIQSLALIGGSFFPVNILPEFLQKLSYISPNGLALKSFLKNIQGYGMSDIIINLIILLAMGIVFTAIGVYVLSKEWGWGNVNSNKAANLETS